MLEHFQIAAGSVIGKDHVSSGKCLIGRNNQDAFAIRRTPEFIAAFVNDGCGSGKHSEVGAWIAANVLADSIAVRYFCRRGLSDRPQTWLREPSLAMELALEDIRKDLLAQIRLMANSFGGSFSQTINDYFLFTTVGVLITPEITQIVAIGDGTYALESWKLFTAYGYIASGVTGNPPLNRDATPPVLHNLGHFPGNMPPYMAYDLVDTSIDPELIKFKVVASMPTKDFGAVLIGSDGVEDLDRIANQKIPGTEEDVGSLWQFWNDGYFNNPDALGRRLRRCNAEVKRLDRETGRIVTHNRLLPDDTTLISIVDKQYHLGDLLP